MARLPVPNSDDDIWGNILNDYLLESHKTDGTLKDNAVTTDSVTNTSITEPKLAAPVQSKLNAGVADATALVKGQIRLTGDLGGTATSPTVPGLANKANTTHSHLISDITSLQTTLDEKATDATVVKLTGNQTIAGTKTFSSAPVVPDASFTIAKTSGLQGALDLKAPLASPALTGTPTAPTATAGTNTTQVATTAFVNAEIAADVPAASDTVAGRVERATDAEVTTGTDTTRYVTPKQVADRLATKANTTHSHLISDVTNLQTTLDGKENVANKSTATGLGTSNTLYPTQNAVKTYADAIKTGAVGVVVHGSVASTARPTGYGVVQWIGSVEPLNATVHDIWWSAN